MIGKLRRLLLVHVGDNRDVMGVDCLQLHWFVGRPEQAFRIDLLGLPLDLPAGIGKRHCNLAGRWDEFFGFFSCHLRPCDDC